MLCSELTPGNSRNLTGEFTEMKASFLMSNEFSIQKLARLIASLCPLEAHVWLKLRVASLKGDIEGVGGHFVSKNLKFNYLEVMTENVDNCDGLRRYKGVYYRIAFYNHSQDDTTTADDNNNKQRQQHRRQRGGISLVGRS